MMSSSLYIGVDLGGTKTKVVLTDAKGYEKRSQRFNTTPTGVPHKDLALLEERIRCVLGPDNVEAIGIAAPGPLDPNRGVVFDAPNLPGWQHTNIGGYLSTAFSTPVYLENDANAAALAEWYFGAGQGCENMVLLTMSTGVGGGLILNGRLYRGELCSAGELGHLPIEWNGEKCGCGQHGCLEAYTGGLNWQAHLRRVAPTNCKAALLAGGVENIRPEHLVQAARAGDAFSCAQMQRWVEFLARALVPIVFAFAPERIVLGTIAVAAGEDLCFDPLRALVKPRLWPHLWERLSIMPAGLAADLPKATACAVARAAAQEHEAR